MNPDYNELSETYDAHYVTPECILENLSIIVNFIDILKTQESDEKKILDLGCGTGLLLDLLGNVISHTSYTGIDISEKMISKAVKKFPHTSLISADAETAVRKMDDIQDIVTSLFSIPYIGIGTMEDIHRLLRKNGYFFCVYYKLPYRNPASVYFGKEDYYLTDIQPRVSKCIGKALDLFKPVKMIPLTPLGAYEVAIFQKR